LPKLKRKKGESKKQNTMRTAMHEFKHGTLHSGSKTGPQVKNRKQAIAIGLSEARKEAGEKAPAAKKKTKKRK
jgi:hypothetical protein